MPKTTKKSTPRKPRSLRNRLIATVHTATKVLSIEKAQYRVYLEDWFPDVRWTKGHGSAGDLTDAQLTEAIQHFRRMGFEPRKGGGRTPKKGHRIQFHDDDAPRIRAIKAMWLHLWRIGAVDTPTEAALNRFCKKHTKRDSVQWLAPIDQNTLIEILKRWTDRVERENRAAAEADTSEANA
ncbi:MAG: regulatory protein GemA [Bacteroidota bacterium]